MASKASSETLWLFACHYRLECRKGVGAAEAEILVATGGAEIDGVIGESRKSTFRLQAAAALQTAGRRCR